MQESGIFKSAVQLPQSERAAYLDKACGSNTALRLEVEGLLRAHDRPGEFMYRPPIADATTIYAPGPERPGMRVGPYKLLQFLGEGGMGTVFLAEQSEPIRRMVALKIVKPGMDSSQVLARFEAERQALALMDHPNIAKVLDAGAISEPKSEIRNPKSETSSKSENANPKQAGEVSDLSSSSFGIVSDFDIRASDLVSSGRPYFVMELVKGVPITEFCDKNKLNTRQRLELFIPVCNAIQHAHMKGIIHRDVKPSNVLIALYDGKPVPKVIDFGVAKAMAERLTQRTLFTQIGQVVGTVEYMSPEQATLNQLDIDTRSDIYSLGVLLYELLTGVTPIDKTKLRTLAFDQMLRAIREEEPMRPSMRLSSARDALAVAAAYRGGDSQKLIGVLRGELDWIVMKCLEKERDRRFVTAGSLAQDIERYLRDEAVTACPPSLGYRLRKAYRKNKAGITVAAACAGLLLAGTAATAWQAIRAVQAERVAVAKQHEAEQAQQAEAAQRGFADDARGKMERERDDANAARAELRHSHYLATMSLVPMAWQMDNVKRVLELLDEAGPRAGEKEDLRNFEWHYWDRLCHEQRRSLPPIDARGTLVVFSGDGKRFVYYKGQPEKIQDRNEQDPNPALDFGKPVTFGFAKKLAPFATPLAIQVADTAEGRAVGPERMSVSGSSFVLNRDGSRLAFVTPDPAGGQNPAKPRQGNVLAVTDVATGKDIVLCRGFVLASRTTIEETRLSISPDGKRLAAFGTIGLDPERRIYVWDITEPGRKPVVLPQVKGFGNLILDLNFDGSRLAVVLFNAETGIKLPSPVSRESSIVVWDTTAGKICGQLTTKDWVRHIVFTPDGKQLIGLGARIGSASLPNSSTTQPQSYLWDGAAGNDLKLLRATPLPRLGFGSSYMHLALSPDGRRQVISHLRGHGLRIMDPATGEERQSIKTIEGVSAAAFSSDGNRLWVAEASTRARTMTKLLFKERDLEPDRRQPIGAPDDGGPREVSVWSKDGTRQAVYQRKPPVLQRPSTLPDGKQPERSVISIRDRDGKEIRQFREHSGPVASLQFSPNGRFVRSQAGGQVMVWEAGTGKIYWRHERFALSLLRMPHSPDLRFLVLSDNDKAEGDESVPPFPQYKIVRFDDLGELFSIGGGLGIVFSPDSRRLVTSSDRIRMWDLEAGREVFSTPSPQPIVVFSGDSRWYATSGGGVRGVTIWDAATGQKRAELHEGLERILAPRNMVFSPDGLRLAVVGSSSPYLESLITTVHDITSGKLVCRLEGNTSPVASVAFSPDGKRIATESGGKDEKWEVKLWDAATGRELLSLPAGGGLAGRLSFSPDGHHLLLQSADGESLTWDAAPRAAAATQQ
jgi:serine/threonine protein kinase/WD40 repeat protein